MFDFSWENIIHSNTLNFLFLIIVLGWLCIPKIKQAIENSSQKTIASINESVDSKKQALQKLEDTKSDYEKTPEEIKDIQQTAMNTLHSLEQKANEDTEEAKKRIVANAEKTIKNEVEKITSELIQNTANNSIISALNDIKTKLQNDEALHDKLIEESINNLDAVK